LRPTKGGIGGEPGDRSDNRVPIIRHSDPGGAVGTAVGQAEDFEATRYG
jgi:hypothetical protein